MGAIPDLSENQVIVFTEWMGRNPQIIEDQIKFPLVTNIQGIPKIKTIRAASMFGNKTWWRSDGGDGSVKTATLKKLTKTKKLWKQVVTTKSGVAKSRVDQEFIRELT